MFGLDDTTAWMAQGLCAQTDPEAFFPEKGGSVAAAKKVCGECPVSVPCLAYALSASLDGERVQGVWAGTTERDRRALRGERTCRDCGVPIPSGKGVAFRCAEHRQAPRNRRKAA